MKNYRIRRIDGGCGCVAEVRFLWIFWHRIYSIENGGYEQMKLDCEEHMRRHKAGEKPYNNDEDRYYYE